MKPGDVTRGAEDLVFGFQHHTLDPFRRTILIEYRFPRESILEVVISINLRDKSIVM